MRNEADRWLGAIFHGYIELLTILAVLFLGIAAVGWAYNRGLRPADRGPLLSTPLLLAAFALALLVRRFEDDVIGACSVAAGMVLAGLLGRGAHPRGTWVPVMAVAALIGLRYNLSAFALWLVTLLALLFSSSRSR